MITIKNIENKKAIDFCSDFYNNMNKNRRQNLDKWCKSNLEKIFKDELGRDLSPERPFLDVMTLNFFEILQLKDKVGLLKYNKKIDTLRSVKNKKYLTIDRYLIHNVYKSFGSKDRRREMLDITNITVCPYCNRNFVDSSENHNTCELDHFYPKSIYPIFAASFYNLIPICPSCNRNKGEKIIEISPYNNRIGTDEKLRFSWEPLSDDYLINRESINIKVHFQDNKYKSDFEMLGLEGLYKKHTDYVQELLWKKHIYTNEYLKKLDEIIHIEDEDFKRLLTGTYTTEENYYKRPLSKFLSDIAYEVGLIRKD